MGAARSHSLSMSAILWMCLTIVYLADAIDSSAKNQYIWYDGTLTGQFLLPDTAPSNCTGFNLTRMVNASMTVGVNPPWDKNPFYWSIQNTGTKVSASAGQTCLNIGGCTVDSIYNFYLGTADYRCFKNGERCGYIVFSPFYYEALQIIDVNAATVQPFNRDGANGYSVVGDPAKFVSNGTVNYNFDFQAPRNYTSRCIGIRPDSSLQFSWNATNTFSYALDFTNTTITANITLHAPAGTIVMLFTGQRSDDTGTGNNTRSVKVPYNNGNYTPIALDTSNSSKPQFMFANGTHFRFDDRNQVVATSSAARRSFVTHDPTWVVIALFFGAFLCSW